LDQAFLSEDLLESVGCYRSWVAYPFISDHALVLLQLENTPFFIAYPFKFNSLWLKEVEFAQIVHDVWLDQNFLQEAGVQRRLVWRLISLKNQTKHWAKQQRLRKLSKLEKLEEDIEAALQGISGGM